MNKNYIILDVETTGLSPYSDEIIGVGLYWPQDNEYRWSGIERLGCSNMGFNVCIGHNIKFDLHFIATHLSNLDTNLFIEDTMLMSYLIDENPPHSLEKCYQKYVNASVEWKGESEEYVNDWKRKKSMRKTDSAWRDMPREMLIARNEQDCRRTWELYQVLKKKIKELKLEELYQTEIKNLWGVLDMERRGVLIDKKYFQQLNVKLILQIENLKKEICSGLCADFNPGSTKQLAEVLETVYGWEPPKTGKGNPKVDNHSLLKWGHPVGKKIIKYRNLIKLSKTYAKSYIDKVGDDNVLHCSFNQAGTTTGRYSSSSPNFQNIPKGDTVIRRGFIARPGYKLVSLDYSQMELRLWAFFSADDKMKEVYKKGGDIHSTTAKALGVGREMGKTINFAITYGMGPGGLQEYLDTQGIHVTLDEAREFSKGLKELYSESSPFFLGVIGGVERRGYVRNPFGRYRHLVKYKEPIKKFIRGRWITKKDNSYSLPNALIQGTGADIMKSAVAKIYEGLSRNGKQHKSNMLALIHDEILCEIHESEMNLIPRIKSLMEDFPQFNPPMKVEVKIGQSWGQMNEYKI